jgi:Glycosyl hydrolase family 26
MEHHGRSRRLPVDNNIHHGRASDRKSCPPHTTYLTIGQDYTSIKSYIENVIVAPQRNNSTGTAATVHYNSGNGKQLLTATGNVISKPSIYMLYTDVQQLRGLYTPVDYGGGIQYADGLLLIQQQQQQQQPTLQVHTPRNTVPVLQIGLWLNGTIGCTNIVQGKLQAQIQQLFYFCIEHVSNTNIDTETETSNVGLTKIYLRIGYEFDNPQFGYTDAPHVYVDAFRYIVDQCYALYSYSTCRRHVEFVWHSWAATLSQSVSSSSPTALSLEDFYPGDEYVDWVGISIFSQLYTNETRPKQIVPLGNRETVQSVCNVAQQHDKPIMIAESTPFGGIPQLDDPWQDWFIPILQLIEQYNIQMWSYIYCDWNAIPMWKNTGFGDSRLEQNATVLQLWYEQVLHNPRFQNVRCDSNTRNSLPSQSLSISKALDEKDNPTGTLQLFEEEISPFESHSDRNNHETFDLVRYSGWIILCTFCMIAMIAAIARRIPNSRNPFQKHNYERIPDRAVSC